MAASAADWIWANSRATNGSLIVLLAIADEIDRKGGEVEMSIAQIAGKARLGDKATRDAVKALAALGELSVTPRQGGASQYRLSTTPADITGVPRQNLPGGRICTPAESTGPVDNLPKKSQVKATPAESTGPVDSTMFVSSTGSKGAEVKDVPAKPPRGDVERLCAHLAERITANGSRPPAITAKWRDAARLLIDKDGVTEEQAHRAIDWCQDSEFWRANILSMPKLREKYDQLRQQARRPLKANGNSKLGIVANFIERAGNE